MLLGVRTSLNLVRSTYLLVPCRRAHPALYSSASNTGVLSCCCCLAFARTLFLFALGKAKTLRHRHDHGWTYSSRYTTYVTHPVPLPPPSSAYASSRSFLVSIIAAEQVPWRGDAAGVDVLRNVPRGVLHRHRHHGLPRDVSWLRIILLCGAVRRA